MNSQNKSNAHQLDAELGGADQQAMRSVVRQLPDDTLSMAWRSALNEKLVAEAAAKQRRQRVSWFLRPALGFGLACTLAVLVLVRAPGHVSTAPVSTLPSEGLEAALVSTHRQNTYAMDVAGVGLNPADLPVESTSSTSATTNGWSEDDLDSL